MSNVIDFETYRAIESLIHEHAWLVDHGEADRLHELYTDNGKIIGIGADRVGRAEIAAYGQTRAKLTKRTTCHVCSNIRIFANGENAARGTVLVTLYRYDGDEIGHATAIAIGEWSDSFVREKSGTWKFSERQLKIVFESPEHRK